MQLPYDYEVGDEIRTLTPAERLKALVLFALIGAALIYLAIGDL